MVVYTMSSSPESHINPFNISADDLIDLIFEFSQTKDKRILETLDTYIINPRYYRLDLDRNFLKLIIKACKLDLTNSEQIINYMQELMSSEVIDKQNPAKDKYHNTIWHYLAIAGQFQILHISLQLNLYNFWIKNLYFESVWKLLGLSYPEGVKIYKSILPLIRHTYGQEARFNIENFKEVTNHPMLALSCIKQLQQEYEDLDEKFDATKQQELAKLAAIKELTGKENQQANPAYTPLAAKPAATTTLQPREILTRSSSRNKK